MSEPFLLQIDNIFDKKKCAELIEIAENIGFHQVENRVAVYDRAILIDPSFAKSLEPIILKLLPNKYQKFRVKLNDHFRFSKYSSGGHFKVHRDGINRDELGFSSVFTLNIFLNTDFEGGETNFFEKDRKTLRYSVKPKIGRGALFLGTNFIVVIQ